MKTAIGEWLGGALIYFVCSSMVGAYLTNENQALNTARLFGFTDPHVMQTSTWVVMIRGCAVGDDARYTITAKNSEGHEQEFFVCRSWLFGGSTIHGQ